MQGVLWGSNPGRMAQCSCCGAAIPSWLWCKAVHCADAATSLHATQSDTVSNSGDLAFKRAQHHLLTTLQAEEQVQLELSAKDLQVPYRTRTPNHASGRHLWGCRHHAAVEAVLSRPQAKRVWVPRHHEELICCSCHTEITIRLLSPCRACDTQCNTPGPHYMSSGQFTAQHQDGAGKATHRLCSASVS